MAPRPRPFSYVEMMTGFGLEEYARLPDFEPVERVPLSRPLADATLGLFTSVGALLLPSVRCDVRSLGADGAIEPPVPPPFRVDRGILRTAHV